MCIILPVDHISCTHTVAVWQHCINAPRSKAYGLEPCLKIRQHARPILTRKLCINCGGPRFFARRGGVAERGKGSAEMVMHQRAKDEWMSLDNDSGYHSDAILEESEDDDFPLSPKASLTRKRGWRHRRQMSEQSEAISTDISNREAVRSPSRRRRPSWRPSLTKEPSEDALMFARNHIHNDQPLSVPSSLDSTTMSNRPQLPALDTTLTHQRRPSLPWRKNSTLLHPSSPPVSPTEPITPPRTPSPPPAASCNRPAFAFPISSKLKPLRPPPPPRNRSTLLHPSDPTPEPTPVSESVPPPQRPSPPRRKSSTLLHPSSPDSPPPSPLSSSSTENLPATNMAPTTSLTPPSSTFPSPSEDTSKASVLPNPLFVFPPSFPLRSRSGEVREQRRPSVLHSSLSDDEDAGTGLGIVIAQRAQVTKAKDVIVRRESVGTK